MPLLGFQSPFLSTTQPSPKDDSNNQTSNDDNNQVNQPEIGSAQTYVSDLRPFLEEAINGYGITLAFDVNVIAKLDDYNYFTDTKGYAAMSPLPNAHQLELDKRLRSPNLYEEIAAKLLADGIKDTGITFIGMDYNLQLYSNDKILCTIPTSGNSNALGSDGLLFNTPGHPLACVDVTIAKQDLATTLPFATAYKDSTGKWPYSLSKGDIVDSKYPPYQTATLSGSNHVDLFYRTSPDSPWIYFTGTQNVLPCSLYNTTDLQKAFLEEICSTADDISKVSL